MTITAESIINAGLLMADKAVIYLARQPKIGNIVKAMIVGEFTIKTYDNPKIALPN